MTDDKFDTANKLKNKLTCIKNLITDATNDGLSMRDMGTALPDYYAEFKDAIVTKLQQTYNAILKEYSEL